MRNFQRIKRVTIIKLGLDPFMEVILEIKKRSTKIRTSKKCLIDFQASSPLTTLTL